MFFKYFLTLRPSFLRTGNNCPPLLFLIPFFSGSTQCLYYNDISATLRRGWPHSQTGLLASHLICFLLVWLKDLQQCGHTNALWTMQRNESEQTLWEPKNCWLNELKRARWAGATNIRKMLGLSMKLPWVCTSSKEKIKKLSFLHQTGGSWMWIWDL